ncbi:MAG: YdeI/OmpD-associated family protein [Vicinamibacteria bacterium]|nr:YdeI/OmpD-associated family protein [Vicinamibacteria bacterium]
MKANPKTPRPVRFEAVLGTITQIRFVVVPPAAGQRLHAGPRTSVRARVLGIEFDSTLTPVRTGGHRLSIPSMVWKPRGLAIGDVIPVELWRVDPAPVVMPTELEPLARANPALRDAYFAISPSDRRQVDRYLARIVSPEARARWIEKIATRLLSPRIRKPSGRRRSG